MTFEEFKSQLAMLLCEQPRGTTADLTGFAVACWDGRDVLRCFSATTFPLKNLGRLSERVRPPLSIAGPSWKIPPHHDRDVRLSLQR
jgi:hypothetical protein